MKSDSNTEMELLLRRHARRRSTALPYASDAAASSSDETTATSGTHLDADEMNAYAEGEMPAAARAHALSHIADCDRCRALVTNLTLYANVPIKEQESDQRQAASSKSSWREWLAALFAPPVIRYGVPALVALCIVGVVILTMRQRDAERRNDEAPLVARNDQRAEETASAVKPEAAQSPATTQSSTARPVEQPSPAQLKEEGTTQNRGLADTLTLGKTKQANDATSTSATKPDAPAMAAPITSSESSRQEKTARDQRDESVVAENRAAAPPPPASVSQPSAVARAPRQPTENDRINQNRKDELPSNDRPATTGLASNTATRESEEKRESLGRSSQSTQARRRSAPRVQTMTDGTDSSGGAAGERSSETRSVGGRKFRRQGSAWVDMAYAQGRATVNVTRGSEQYRALVADEPGLRTIADQLGGEVIVVWRGRAYRIR